MMPTLPAATKNPASVTSTPTKAIHNLLLSDGTRRQRTGARGNCKGRAKRDRVRTKRKAEHFAGNRALPGGGGQMNSTKMSHAFGGPTFASPWRR
jgi:hypothetical protein